MSKSIILYSDGSSFLYKPRNIKGFLLLNYNKILNKIYYNFFNNEIDKSLIKLIENKQNSLRIYNLFYKFLTEEGEIEVINLSEFNEDIDNEAIDNEDTNEIEEFFGFKYYEDTDIQIVDSLINFHIE
tara:strand:- start:2175 stop:2558 length:384 start_codon:yes stop_codon:yes gene_type:complete